LLLTVPGWPPWPEYINARHLLYQWVEQYVGIFHFSLRLCEIAPANWMFGLYFLTLYSELSEKSYRTLCYAWPGCMSSAILAGAISQSRNEKWNIPTYCSTHWYNKCLALMYSGHGGQPGTVRARTSNDFRVLLLLIHWNLGDISLEEGPDYWYLTPIFFFGSTVSEFKNTVL
jgi:hypothetical protein